ncbi:hypothetical protein RSAG8_10554, partial [Rhizoctonia solani AG-8 WAC10335]
MTQRTAADILKLPNSLNGHAIAASLLTSLALSIITIGLVAPVGGFYQYFVLIAAGPATIVHHITIICLLCKHCDETTKTPLVPTCLTCTTNIGFMALFELIWLAGTAVGFWLYALYHESTDMNILPGLAITSNIVGLLQCFVFSALIVFCIRARNERSQAGRELGLA